MKIIIAPAKKMRQDREFLLPRDLPANLEQTEQILRFLRSLSGAQLQKLWGCSDKIAAENIRRLENMDLYHGLTPAILAYDGIAFQYMAPGVFEDRQFEYVQEHLCILSGFYGVLKPLDGVAPYRLEMQAKVQVNGSNDLYDFWSDRLYSQVRDDSGVIINLASGEYSRAIEKYLTSADTFITCTFAERENGKLIQKGVYAKMARGEMVRYMAEHDVTYTEQLKAFNRLGYVFSPEYSSESEYLFIRSEKDRQRENSFET